MSISANTFASVTRTVQPSIVAYYMAYAYLSRSERLMQGWTRTGRERQKMIRVSFLNEIAKKYIRLSDELTKLEKEFSRKG